MTNKLTLPLEEPVNNQRGDCTDGTGGQYQHAGEENFDS